MSSMTTQLPIIPPRQAPPRPKLSINTEQPRILGKGASLRLETLSAVSPTVRNTFSNAYERPSTAPALQRPQRPQLSIESDFPACSSASTPSSASTLSSTLTSASNDSATHSIPYKQPHNLASILSNSPARSIIPRKMNSSRPMFPAEKRVSFRTPLEEEITTTKYTLAHSDIESSCSTLSSIASSASTATNESEASTSQPSLTLKPCKTAPETSISPLQLSLLKSSSTLSSAESSPKREPRTGEKRDSSSSEDDSDSCPETPVAGRRKRTRDWRWTLGPLPTTDKSSSASSASSASDAASEDSSY
ncbi:hypothetical protein PtrSN002B_006882 [Pyrenophora tritici-repentis]|uniref:Tymo-45kd-70kd domain containing protein n=2 Tax=Pyrenophora tritici-repentis TaxID=45151 RepID=A0A2W1DAD8_9PLEO|nr:uncharacterized protein PTRG_06014 [Pyrenophora tritici-repentis Pt-1C-BFP]KAA8619149.1 hypothetical protein PtrV1_08578 [Pyrenophora tritici-repentis]EDU48934.1 conserved hypothetical protein [Pyrenophora tritici-repentis Pt-1C-BFP]KAF7449620.1 hypothetical protein A1F99_066690 [Pyrenophora tritici-repentis]KAF7570260.1 Tymo-45kd-70kd domain containing protein [Pyrenophora tritici-repentis]KAG9383447.1 hypothetical protein A1F94_005358 [Pyrenophora tritici-repentis]